MAGRNKRAARAEFARLTVEVYLDNLVGRDDEAVRAVMAKVTTDQFLRGAVLDAVREPIYETRLTEPLFPELVYGRKKP